MPVLLELQALCWKRVSVDSYIGKVDESGTIADKQGNDCYWCSSQISDQNDSAWTAAFSFGRTNRTQKGSNFSVRQSGVGARKGKIGEAPRSFLFDSLFQFS